MQVFFAYVVICANDAPLDESKRAFDGIGVNVPTGVLAQLVANPRVTTLKRWADAFVAHVIVCHDPGAGINYSLDLILESLARNVSDDAAADLTISLDSAEHNGFLVGSFAIVDPLVAGLAAHKRLIAFHYTV